MSAPDPQLPFRCKHCGTQCVAWLPRCPHCSYFNSFVSEQDDRIICSTDPRVSRVLVRWPTGVPVVDGVLLGGVVEHSVVLVAGIAGAGKSTILAMVAGGLARLGKRVLYICAEEEVTAVIARCERTGSLDDRLDLIRTTDANHAARMARHYDAAIYDSIQPLHVLAEEIQSPKTRILVSQLNKEGDIRGERGNEHSPDALLFCDYDPQTEKRQILTTKNRHGALKSAPYELVDTGARGFPCPECTSVLRPCPCPPKKKKKKEPAS